jgi:hypothetical protein
MLIMAGMRHAFLFKSYIQNFIFYHSASNKLVLLSSPLTVQREDETKNKHTIFYDIIIKLIL